MTDIFDRLSAEEHPEVDPITHKDVFDRVAKDMTFPTLKVYVPPKRVELSPEQKEAVRLEIERVRVPEKVTEKVTERIIETWPGFSEDQYHDPGRHESDASKVRRIDQGVGGYES